MPIQNRLRWRNFIVWFVFIIQMWFPGVVLFMAFPEHLAFLHVILTEDFTLRSLEIFKKREWFKSKLKLYFQCKGENKTVLPDVTKKHVLYTFRGQESWQPLTEIHGAKCKRCGFYERHRLRSDHVFDEWEFCPSDFTAGQTYVHFKAKEINATFLCHGCAQLHEQAASNVTASSGSGTGSQKEEEKDIKVVVVIAGSVAASAGVVVGLIVIFRYLQKKKRQKEQARFMKLFEDGDEFEDEIGLEP